MRSIRLWIVIIFLLIGGAILVVWTLGACRGKPESIGSSMPANEVLMQSAGTQIVGAIKSISTNRLRNSISDLQGFGERSSWEKQSLTQQYLIEQLNVMVLHPQIEEYSYKNQVFSNILLTFPGRVYLQKKILVVAHYDTKNWTTGLPSPGADDNGTGVSVLLELARIIRKLDHRLTWQFVFTSNEEKGRQGSRDWARRARREGIDIAAVIAVDIVGYRPSGLSEVFPVIRSSLNMTRKIKGLVKIFYNRYLSLRNGCSSLKLAFRETELPLAPPASFRKAVGNAIFWQLGGACA